MSRLLLWLLCVMLLSTFHAPTSYANYQEEPVRLDRRVIGGTNAGRHAHPYMASFQLDLRSLCQARIEEIRPKFNCFNHLNLQWRNDGVCTNARVDVHFYYRNMCMKGGYSFMPLNWQWSKSTCAWNNENVQKIFMSIAKNCWNYDESSLVNNNNCNNLLAKQETQALLADCAVPPAFTPEDAEKTNGWKHGCGGALIKDHWVLTAAHCLEVFQPGKGLNSYRVVLDDHSLEAEDATEDIKEIAQTIKYNGWDTKTLKNDIGLIKLQSKVTPSAAVQTIQLSVNDDAYINNQCVVAGWGRVNSGHQFQGNNNAYANILQETHITNIPTSECKTWATGANMAEVTNKNICVHGRTEETRNAGACHGDSGGPLVCGQNKDKLAGVLSWGHPLCSGTPSVFTRVSSYKDWIDSTTN